MPKILLAAACILMALSQPLPASADDGKAARIGHDGDHLARRLACPGSTTSGRSGLSASLRARISWHVPFRNSDGPKAAPNGSRGRRLRARTQCHDIPSLILLTQRQNLLRGLQVRQCPRTGFAGALEVLLSIEVLHPCGACLPARAGRSRNRRCMAS